MIILKVVDVQVKCQLPENDWPITLDCGKAIFLLPLTVYGRLGGTGGGLSYKWIKIWYYIERV